MEHLQALSKLTLAELKLQQKKLTKTIVGLWIIWPLVLAVLVYTAIQKQSYELFVLFIPISVITTLPIIQSIGNIKKEIDNRSSNNRGA